MLEEPNRSGSSRFQDFGKVTLVSRDASLGSFGLDMMVVRSDAGGHQQRDEACFQFHFHFAIPGVAVASPGGPNESKSIVGGRRDKGVVAT